MLDGDSGKVVDQWPVGTQTNLQFLIIPADRSGIWGFTDTTAKIAKWDFNGRLLYSWGVLGDFPARSSTCTARASIRRATVRRRGRGRTAPEIPSAQGANPAFLVGPPVYSAWK